jgi:hypothetical protein
MPVIPMAAPVPAGTVAAAMDACQMPRRSERLSGTRKPLSFSCWNPSLKRPWRVPTSKTMACSLQRPWRQQRAMARFSSQNSSFHRCYLHQGKGLCDSNAHKGAAHLLTAAFSGPASPPGPPALQIPPRTPAPATTVPPHLPFHPSRLRQREPPEKSGKFRAPTDANAIQGIPLIL